MQEGDVDLFNESDGGNILVENGLFEMTGGLGGSVYLSLFGGNADDNGTQDSDNEWWGNIDETEPDRKYRSETQFLLKSIPASSANLRRVHDAAGRDLQWLIDSKVASKIEVEVTIPALNEILIVVNIGAFGQESEFKFSQNWEVAL